MGINQIKQFAGQILCKHSDIQKLNSKIEQEKNPALKLAKKIETTGIDTVTQAQNYLKSINKKLKLWDLYSL